MLDKLSAFINKYQIKSYIMFFLRELEYFSNFTVIEKKDLTLDVNIFI